MKERKIEKLPLLFLLPVSLFFPFFLLLSICLRFPSLSCSYFFSSSPSSSPFFSSSPFPCSVFHFFFPFFFFFFFFFFLCCLLNFPSLLPLRNHILDLRAADMTWKRLFQFHCSRRSAEPRCLWPPFVAMTCTSTLSACFPTRLSNKKEGKGVGQRDRERERERRREREGGRERASKRAREKESERERERASYL